MVTYRSCKSNFGRCYCWSWPDFDAHRYRGNPGRLGKRRVPHHPPLESSRPRELGAAWQGERADAVGHEDRDRHPQAAVAALALGEALAQALGEKRGIARYGFSPLTDAPEAELRSSAPQPNPPLRSQGRESPLPFRDDGRSSATRLARLRILQHAPRLPQRTHAVHHAPVVVSDRLRERDARLGRRVELDDLQAELAGPALDHVAREERVEVHVAGAVRDVAPGHLEDLPVVRELEEREHDAAAGAHQMAAARDAFQRALVPAGRLDPRKLAETAFNLACAEAELRHTDAALKALQRCLAAAKKAGPERLAHFQQVMTTDPSLKALQRDPRLQRLLAP